VTIPVVVETDLGAFTIAVDDSRAPVTAGNFLAYVDGRHLDGAVVYRIVTMANQPPETVHRIEVVQWGLQASEDKPAPFPPIAHETTEATGIRHRHMTVSMARLAPGTAGSEFFICIGDQPELDFGGRRNPDGQGFAAFGTVVAGEETVMRLFGAAQSTEALNQPIPISHVRRG
jgi:peptidyl-prolyl cis-trans isomerase A (cyclophilin A)